MKLYHLKRGDHFVIVGDNRWPPAHISPAPDTIYRFGHLDGMYSYCHIMGGPNDGAVVHPVAWALVEKMDDSSFPVEISP